MKKWFKRGGYGLVILLIAGYVGWTKTQGLVVETSPVQRQNVTATVVEKGKIISSQTIDLYSELQGKIQAVYRETGDFVTPGTILATINNPDLESQIAQLEGELKAVSGQEKAAQLNPLSSQLKQQQLVIDQASISVKQAAADYDRTQQLYNVGGVTKAALDQAQADLATKQKALAQAEAGLKSLREQTQGNKLLFQGQRESLQARLDQLKSQRTKTKIVANQQGVVFAKKIKAGDYISPGMLLFTLGNIQQTEIETYINNKDIANVRKGSKLIVTFLLPGEDISTTAEITKISPVAEEKLSALGILEDKVRVTAKLLQKPAQVTITPGMTIDVTVTTQEAKQVLSIPKDAVFTENGKDYVWIIQNNQAKLAQIQQGVEGDELVEVKAGLKEKDQVLLNPHQTTLKEGLKVTPAK